MINDRIPRVSRTAGIVIPMFISNKNECKPSLITSRVNVRISIETQKVIINNRFSQYTQYVGLRFDHIFNRMKMFVFYKRD